METIEQIHKMYKKAIEVEYSDPNQSYRIAKDAFGMSKKIDSVKGMADGFYRICCACRVMSNYGECLKNALSGLSLYKDLKDYNGIVNTYMMIGIVYFYSGDYSTALEYFISAKNHATDDSVPCHRAIAIANNIGEVYREAGDYEKALESFESGLSIACECGHGEKVAYVYNNISQVYMILCDYDKAYETCVKAMEKMHKADDRISIVTTEYIFGELLMHRGDYIGAETYYDRSFKKLKEMKNQFYMIELLINMSELERLKGREPVSYLIEALELAQSIESSSKACRVYKLLSEYYEFNGDYKRAMAYYKNYHMTEKAIEADNLSQRLALLLVEIDYSKEKNDHEQLKSFSEKLKRDRNLAIEELEKIRQENLHLQKLNIIDELTQVLNKRGIYNELRELLTVGAKDKSALFIVDIDHFKKYNDTWGHIQGDKTLQVVAKALSSISIENFTVGRFGGEEFVCHAFVKSEEEAKNIAQNINKTVEYLQIQMDKVRKNSYLTVSIGGVIGEVTYDRVTHWLDVADKELYLAKDAGRNRFAIKEII